VEGDFGQSTSVHQQLQQEVDHVYQSRVA